MSLCIGTQCGLSWMLARLLLSSHGFIVNNIGVVLISRDLRVSDLIGVTLDFEADAHLHDSSHRCRC